MKKFVFAAVALASLSVVIFAQNQSENDENIHPPYYSIGISPPYDADRVIEMTLHDYIRSPERRQFETSGRFTTFGIERKYLSNAATIADGRDVRFFLTVFQWDPNEPDKIWPGIRFEPEALDPSIRYIMSASLWAGHKPNLPILNQELRQSKLNYQKFPGYAPGAGLGQIYLAREIYDLRETYCGFELFEHRGARRWQLSEPADLTRPAPTAVPEPFDRARIFALPNDEGDYSIIAQCQTSVVFENGENHCQIETEFNDYIMVRYGFEGKMLCHAPALIAAHQQFLESKVVAQNEFQSGIQ
ncbi:hypothetical protein [Pseudaestuariivita rosea]|uniref:hypothetical protein n=1 Tax=Pseudaestuariivita rosea TaxID=2763263 RepID=UPI001ABB75E5|nr:hypothetical protein [Pseudaestuariivita rosea]